MTPTRTSRRWSSRARPTPSRSPRVRTLPHFSTQYHGERMAPATTPAALTEWTGYDIHADAKSAQAIQEAAAHTERLESFIGAVQSFNYCVPLCVVSTAAALTPPGAWWKIWLQECGFNCLVQATGLVPDYVYLSARKVPRSGRSKRHSSHPPLDKRLERLERPKSAGPPAPRRWP